MEDSEDTLLHEWFEQVWNQGREEAIDRLFSEEGVAHGLSSETGEAVRGPKPSSPSSGPSAYREGGGLQRPSSL